VRVELELGAAPLVSAPQKPEVPGRVIGLWFVDRPKLRAFLEGLRPETRRGLEAMIWQDPRFRRVREHVAKQEDVLFYFSEIISLNRSSRTGFSGFGPTRSAREFSAFWCAIPGFQMACSQQSSG
jgi:hypothetical protein